MIATARQSDIIKEPKSCVIIAKPGSGKTYVLSEKIKNILSDSLEYQGVIAISYTNKASAELKSRSLVNETDKKGSFFGTIDKFMLSEIIMPFGKHIFGACPSEMQVCKLSDVPQDEQLTIRSFLDTNDGRIPSAYCTGLSKMYSDGKIILETVGVLALHIYDHSKACRDYLKARYTHVMIDEYQDSGFFQHELFLRLKLSGMCAVAVGDIDQSIYAFSGRDSKYLVALSSKDSGFKIYPLDMNHRSHPSIINYSTGLLIKDFEQIKTDDIRVFEKIVDGSEKDLSQWLDSAIPLYADKYSVKNAREIAILVRNNRTGEIIDKNLTVKHKYSVASRLDEDTSLWSNVFRELMYGLFGKGKNDYELVEEYLNLEFEKAKVSKLSNILRSLRILIQKPSLNVNSIVKEFLEFAKLVYPNAENRSVVKILEEVLFSQSLIDAFRIAEIDEVQIMTLHKAKGLEFSLVFHLDLYEYILPRKVRDDSGNWGYDNISQDLNLHYVGITRAKTCCILCSSTSRSNFNGAIIRAQPSEFYAYNARLITLREVSKI